MEETIVVLPQTLKAFMESPRWGPALSLLDRKSQKILIASSDEYMERVGIVYLTGSGFQLWLVSVQTKEKKTTEPINSSEEVWTKIQAFRKGKDVIPENEYVAHIVDALKIIRKPDIYMVR